MMLLALTPLVMSAFICAQSQPTQTPSPSSPPSSGQTGQNKSGQTQPSPNQARQNQPASSTAASEDAAAQDSSDSGNSLAGAAKTAKLQRAAHAKKVFTDEDMEETRGPLPLLNMEGAENSDDVVAAISKYKLTHNADETEQAVHIWYDRYDQMLAAAIQENQDMMSLRNANVSNGYALCQESQDYQKCASRQMAEQRGAQSDQTEIMKNNALEVRIQHSFMKVRNGLNMNNLHYSWFKIRTTNNIDQF
jgi:hypothetical protein